MSPRTLAACLACSSWLAGCGRDTLASAEASEAPEARVATRVAPPAVPDEELVDQRGGRVKLYSDLVKGRVVVVDFVFTRCTTICSPMTATLARAQRQLSERGVTDVRFVSISLDPAADTPERLRAFADRFGVDRDFSFLTGEPARVARALEAFRGFAAVKDAHAAVFVVGNEATGRWRRLFGLVPPSAIVDAVADVRSVTADGGGG